jgi:hypothetical protein
MAAERVARISRGNRRCRLSEMARIQRGPEASTRRGNLGQVGCKTFARIRLFPPEAAHVGNQLFHVGSTQSQGDHAGSFHAGSRRLQNCG